MKNIFKNRSIKFDIIHFSGLLLATSIVCPLTSCGSDGTSNDIGGFDKEFGFDAQTYNNLERQFISKYGASLKEKDIDKDTYINKFNDFLLNDLAVLRNKLFDPAQNYSFTVRTNTIMDYASKNFDINLNRNTSVSDVDFDNLRQTTQENLVVYMENMQFSKVEINEKIIEFNKEFNKILKNCKSKTSDNTQILIQLRADIIDCWSDFDDKIAYLSAYNHLKNFFDEYQFEVKENNKDEILWDNLLNNPDFMGEKTGKIDQDINCKIDQDQIDNLFTISQKSKESTSGKTIVKYKKDMIPDFILTPVLKTMSQDIYSNNYYMNIDWQLIKADKQNEDQETINSVTAHLATPKDGKVVDYADFKDGQLPSDSYEFTKYSFKATPKYQQEKMFEAYFDQTKEPDQKITFSWDKDILGIEYFLPSDAKSKDFVPADTYDVTIAKNNLSLMGLQLNGNNLSDLLNKQNNSQDNQSADDADNDEKLKIEEKFVKYCDINSIANVSFSDNEITKNSIQNDFVASFTNSNNMQYNVETKSNMNNIEPSKIFSNNAVDFYKQVADYVDTGKILETIESNHWLTNMIGIELYILFGVITLLLILALIRYNFIYHQKNSVGRREVINTAVYDGVRIDQGDLLYQLQRLIPMAVVTLALFFAWKFGVSNPISNEVNKIKKWNDSINGSKSDDSDDSDTFKDINVINKVKGKDKENFESTDNFMKFYGREPNSAFESYYYYFHFTKLLQNQTDIEQTTAFDEKVKKDYEQFNATKITFDISDRNIGRIVLEIMTLSVIAFALFMIWTNYKSTKGALGMLKIHMRQAARLEEWYNRMFGNKGQ